jgi:branched-chain amino acid transport system permease protein
MSSAETGDDPTTRLAGDAPPLLPDDAIDGLGAVRGRISGAIDRLRLGAARVESALPSWLVRPIGNPVVHAGVVLAALIIWAVGAPANDYNLYLAQLACVYAIAALGLNIPGGLGGALSLGHGASFALGVYSAGILAANHGWPVWGTLPVALGVGFVAGLLMGAPAGRLGVIALAMVSLAWVLVVGDMILEFDGITGGTGGLSGITMRFVPGDSIAAPEAVPVVIFIVGWMVYLAHWWYRSSRYGRAAIASRDEPIGAASSGISTYRIRMETFAIGSAIGALAGGLFGYMLFIVSPSTVSPQLSILFLVMIVLGGAGSRLGPVIGALVLTLVPNWLDGYAHVNTLMYGALLVVIVLLLPRGVMGAGRPSRPRPFGRLNPSREAIELPSLGEASRAVVTPDAEPVLRMRDVVRHFGEVKATDGVDFVLYPGEVVGLVGPNGSGKTTLLNLASGMYHPSSGSIELCGRDVTRTAPHRIAASGLARTFQTPKTFPSLSIGEHLAIASREMGDASPAHRQRAVDTSVTLLRMGGIDANAAEWLSRPVGTLAQGQLRFLEVAMAALHAPKVLLLDEPAAGLSADEMEGLERATRALANQGAGVVIVEHHLELIRRLVDRVVVLHLGEELWEGPPSELETAEAVRVAYLGIQQ